MLGSEEATVNKKDDHGLQEPSLVERPISRQLQENLLSAMLGEKQGRVL